MPSSACMQGSRQIVNSVTCFKEVLYSSGNCRLLTQTKHLVTYRFDRSFLDKAHADWECVQPHSFSQVAFAPQQRSRRCGSAQRLRMLLRKPEDCRNWSSSASSVNYSSFVRMCVTARTCSVFRSLKLISRPESLLCTACCCFLLATLAGSQRARRALVRALIGKINHKR